MVKRILGWLAVMVLQAVLVPVPAAAGTVTYILRSPSQASAQAVCQRYGLTLVGNLGNSSVWLVQGSDSVTFSALQSWTQNDPDVLNFQMNNRMSISERNWKNPPSYSPYLPSSNSISDRKLAKLYGTRVWSGYVQQPATASMNLFSVLSPSMNGSGVTIAVIDTGVDPNNPILAPVLVRGYDFTRNVAGYASDLADLNQSTAAILEQSTAAILEQQRVVQLNQSTAAILEQSTAAILEGQQLPALLGHGTMVSGLIHLVAPGAQIMPLKAFGADGSSDESNIIRAIYYATDNGAHVINMSFEMTQFSDELMRAINYAARNGVICVASVGNDSQKTLVYPAALGNVVSVGSVSQQDVASNFSNFGPDLVTLAAPGEGLVTTYLGSHYAEVWGTSFSNALVSGATALLVNAAKTNTAYQLAVGDARRALSQANPACSPDGGMGAGCLDINQATQYMNNVILPPTQGTAPGGGAKAPAKRP